LPRQDDHSDGPSTMPAPELNPLLNPILGANMGRWAEVYFTSPPEKREQAVLDLLRELQGDEPVAEVAAPSESWERESLPIAAETSRPHEVPVPMLRCQACGQGNPASHRFCGMCGAAVIEPRSAADLNIADLHVADHVAELPVAEVPVADFRKADFQSTDFESNVRRGGLRREYPPTGEYSAGDDRPGNHRVSDDRHGDDRRVAHLFAQDPAPLAQSREPQFLRTATAVSEPAFNSNEFLSERGRREFNEHEYTPSHLFEPALDSRPYRLYIGIVVAVILVLAYVAWRSMQMQASKATLTPPAATTQTDTPTPYSPSASDSPDRTSEAAPSANTKAAVPSNAVSSNATPANRAAERRASHPSGTHPSPGAATATPDATTTAASPTSIDEKSLQAEAVSANGAGELAIAQRYLSGTDGQARNSAEGAKWLWKAIAKHNADATLLLSDLYLKGDGVPKNCDQARVLLDAAAVRGMKGAGDRLRHLQAFGCQ